MVNSHLLYQLSYAGMTPRKGRKNIPETQKSVKTNRGVPEGESSHCTGLSWDSGGAVEAAPLGASGYGAGGGSLVQERSFGGLTHAYKKPHPHGHGDGAIGQVSGRDGKARPVTTGREG